MVANKELKKTGFLRFESLWPDGGTCSLFIDRSGKNRLPSFIWCNTDGWDHVFASYADRSFTKPEVELIKRFFFRPGEWSRVLEQPVKPGDPRNYGIHLWLRTNRHAPQPPAYAHVPQTIKETPWMIKISPAYQMAVSFQAMANNTTPDELLAAFERSIDPEKLSVEEYFLSWIHSYEKGA